MRKRELLWFQAPRTFREKGLAIVASKMAFSSLFCRGGDECGLLSGVIRDAHKMDEAVCCEKAERK